MLDGPFFLGQPSFGFDGKSKVTGANSERWVCHVVSVLSCFLVDKKLVMTYFLGSGPVGLSPLVQRVHTTALGLSIVLCELPTISRVLYTICSMSASVGGFLTTR